MSVQGIGRDICRTDYEASRAKQALDGTDFLSRLSEADQKKAAIYRNSDFVSTKISMLEGKIATFFKPSPEKEKTWWELRQESFEEGMEKQIEAAQYRARAESILTGRISLARQLEGRADCLAPDAEALAAEALQDAADVFSDFILAKKKTGG